MAEEPRRVKIWFDPESVLRVSAVRARPLEVAL